MTLANRVRLKYMVSDYLMTNIGWLVFNIVRYFTLQSGADERTLEVWLFSDINILLGQVIYPLMMLMLYALSGYYNRVMIKSRLDEIENTAVTSFICMLLIFFITLINDDVPERLRNYELMTILWALLAIPCYVGRLIVNSESRKRLSQGRGLYNALIIGPDKDAKHLASRLARTGKPSEFNVVGYVDSLDSLDNAITKLQPQVLIMASLPEKMSDNMDAITRLFGTELEIYVPFDIYRVITPGVRLSSVVGEPIINITSAGIKASTENLKRVGDIVFSAIALIVLLPIFALIAIIIKTDSPGTVFYLQERVGYRKKIFRIIKFRTMRADAESMGPALSSAVDSRITRVGRFLRKYRIDELPQFWNVLKGEMSLVGPRPEREFYVRQIVERVPQYSLVHKVRPGITSWGMVKFGYAGSVDEMVERLRYDLLYIENVSFGVDLKILFHTIATVITGKGV